LRSANAYGPEQLASTHGVVSRFVYNILHGKPIEIWGSPHITRDFIFIEDLVRAIRSSMRREVQNVTLNVASGKGVRLSSLVREIEVATARRAKVKLGKGRAIDVPRLYFSIDETKKILRWRPENTLAEGIAKTAAWIRGTHQS